MNSFYTKIHIIILVLILSIFCIPTVQSTHAQNGNIQGGYTLLEPLPDITNGGGSVTNVQFQDYIGYAFNLMIALAAVAAVFMIVWGGLQYMSTDAWEGKSAGISKLKNAVLGLLLILCSYLILRTIDPRLVTIPSTLVPPLTGLDYTPQINNFLKGITGEMNSMRVENAQILTDVNSARQTVDDLEIQIQELMGEEGWTDSSDYESVCQTENTDLPAACAQYAALIDQQKTAEVAISGGVARGVMNDIVVGCTAGSPDGASDADLATCRSKLLAARDKRVAELNALGDPAAAAKVMDYGVYASTLLDMNQSVTSKIGSGNWITSGLKSTTEAALYATGPVNGLIGGVVINATSNAWDRSNAALAVTEINSAMSRNVGHITDPTIKAKLVSQATAIVRSLGGTPTF